MIAMKTCSKCTETKPVYNFRRRADSRDGYNAQCRDCLSTANIAYKARNREALRKQDADYRASIEGRAARAYAKSLRTCRKFGISSQLTLEQTVAEFKSTPNCPYCGEALGMEPDKRKPTLDHVFPLSGDIQLNTIDNIVVCCHECNIRKSDRFLLDFYHDSTEFTDALFAAFMVRYTRKLLGYVDYSAICSVYAGMVEETADLKRRKDDAG